VRRAAGLIPIPRIVKLINQVSDFGILRMTSKKVFRALADEREQCLENEINWSGSAFDVEK
jgi:hypothetical protein